MKSTEGQPGSSLTKRELDVLELIALGLTNAEIARQLSLSRRTVDTHVERILGKLRAPTRTRAVFEASRARLLRGVPDTGRRSHNLPVQLTNFIGRSVQLSEVKALLGTSRLITIVGAGGVGKTRLAVQIGAELLNSSRDGVWLVDLAKVSGVDPVVPAIASALGVKARGFRTLEEHLLAFLRRKRLLLVLDNCEHVVAEAARVVSLILTKCPEVSFLTTSRERLGETGERVYRLPSLDVPSADSEPRCETILEFSAVALFVDRARAADSHFEVSNVNASAISDICRRLDGIALAIELAAGRVTTLSAQQILKRLREQFRILTGSDRGVHPRHRTMRATLDWSYEWLTETEQALFRHLAIFQGGWTIETIDAANVNATLDDFGVLDVLSSLVDKSIVVAELRGDGQRYRLMEPLRQYGLERLTEAGEFEATAAQHARYFAEFTKQEAAHWLTPSEPSAIEKVDEEINNIRAALEWTLVRGNAPWLGAEIAERLGHFWITRHFHEGLRWLEIAQTAVSYKENPLLSGAIAAHRLRLYGVSGISKTLPICEEAFGPLHALVDDLPLRRVLMFYGLALLALNRLDEAEAALQDALERCERANDRYRITFQLLFLARLNRKRGKLERARELSIRGCEIYESLGLSLDPNRVIVLAEQARLEQLAGDLDRAIVLSQAAYAVTQEMQDPVGAVQAEYFLAALYFLSGATGEACRHGRAILKVSREELLPHGIAPAVQVLSGVAAQRGRYELAAQLFGYAERRFQEQTYPRDSLVEVESEWFMAALTDGLGEQELANLIADGATWSEDRAIQEGLSV